MEDRKKTFKVFEFAGRTFFRTFFSCYGSMAESRDEVIRRCRRLEPYIETELVVLPKKWHRSHPVTHTLAQSPDYAPDTRFVGILDDDTFHRLGRKADSAWAKDQSIKRAWAREAGRNRHGTRVEDLPVRLRSRVRVDENGCWLWITKAQRRSLWKAERRNRTRRYLYGSVKYNGQKWAAHRLVYTLLVCEIPEGLMLRHECDTPACVNPMHLVPGIPEDNVRDMIDRGRAAWQRVQN